MSPAPAVSPPTRSTEPAESDSQLETASVESLPMEVPNAPTQKELPRRRLAQKLMLFYVLPLTVLLLAGFLIPLLLWSYFGSYVSEYRTAMALTTRVREMAQDANNAEAAAREYFLSSDEDALSQFREERIKVTLLTQQLTESLEVSGTPRMKDVLKEFDAVFRQWYSITYSSARRLERKPGSPQAMAASASTRTRFVSVKKNLNVLTDLAEKAQQRSLERSRGAEVMRTVTSIVIPAGALLLTLLVGRSLALAITRPLEELTEATRELEQGRGVLLVQQSSAQETPNDEIGDLQRAFVRMARTIGQRETMLRAQNDTLGSLNQRIAAVLNATNDGIILLDRTGAFSVVNQKFTDLFGVDGDLLLDQSFPQAAPLLVSRFTDRTAVRERLERLIADPTAAADESLEMLEPTPRVLRMYTAPVRRDSSDGGDSELMGRIFVFRDVTRETQADRMKTEFVSMVSHELRTPLTAIKGYVDLMVSGQTGELNEVQTEFLTMVQDSARRLHALINDILDIARIESGKMDIQTVSVDYVSLAEQAVKMMQQEAAKKEISLTLFVTGGTQSPHPAVSGDADRITQVLVNLISNGIKYTPNGGKVTVHIEFAHDFVTTCIEDTGIGLSVNEQRQLFQRFFRADNSTTRETGGTGLGLAITKAILDRLGGSIWVESEPGVGSRFWFTLPCSTDGVVSATEAEGQYLALIIDGNTGALHRLSHELRRKGVVATNATNAADALRRARSLHPDIILLNPLTPELDAMALLQSLRARPEIASIPLAFIMPRIGSGQADLVDMIAVLPRRDDYPDLKETVHAALKGERGNIAVVVVGDANLARAVREATSDFRDTIVTVADAPAEADKALGGVFPDLIVIDSQSAPDTQAGEWITRLLRQNPGERLSVILVTNPEALQGTITTLPPLGAGPLPLSALGTTVKNILD